MGVASSEAYEQVLMNTNCCFPNSMGSMKITLTQASLTPAPPEAAAPPSEHNHSSTLELSLLILPMGGFVPQTYTLTLVQKCRFRSYVHEERGAKLRKVELSEALQQQGGILEVHVPLPSDFSPTHQSSFCTIWTELVIHFYDEQKRYLKFVTFLSL